MPLFSRFAAVAALLFSSMLLPPAVAQADPEATSELPPRDVAVFVQPDAVRLPSLPPDFEQLEEGGWLTLEFPSSVRERVLAIAHEAEAFRDHLAADLGQPVLAHVLVRVARTPDQMTELAPSGAPPPAYAVGVAYPSIHLALLALQAPDTWQAPDLTEVARHELSHLALEEASASHHVPRWFDEGLAVYESGEAPWARTKELWEATLGRRLLSLADLDRSFPTDRYEVNVAYAESADVTRFLMRDPDRARFGSLVQRIRSGTPFGRALEDAYGTDVRKLEYEWREEVTHRFSLFPLLTGSGMLWVVASGLAIAAWWRRRKHAKAKLATWAREEAEIDAALAKVREPSPPAREVPAEDVGLVRALGVPLVEHEGRWYTLH